MSGPVPTPNPSTLFSLQNKTAITTGSTGGLGLSMTLALASAGATILSLQVPSDPLASNLTTALSALPSPPKLKIFECDLRSSTSIRHTFEKIWQEGHQADILLNCAGIQRRNEAENFTDEEIEAVLDVNLKATIVACQEFAKPILAANTNNNNNNDDDEAEQGDGKVLRRRRKGKIINVASIISFIGGRNITPYAASKGGVMQVTKAFSNEWACKGINVNSIHPGYFTTALTEQYQVDPKYKDFNEYVLMRTPMKRWGRPEDLSGAVIFLASEASEFVTGSSVTVDGGWMGN